MKAFRSPVVIAAAAMVVLPFALLAGGLTLTSATDVVIFAVACMALNILVGHTGLVSFGHGAWFGVGAYAAALTQKYWFPGSVLWPVLTSLLFLLDRRRAHRVPRAAPARRLLLAADARVLGADLRDRVSLDGVHRRRERTGRRHARELVRRRPRESLDLLHAGRGVRPGRRVRARALSSLGDRHRAGGHPRKRAARAVHRLRDQPLQADRLRRVGGADRMRRRAVRVPSSLRVGRPDVDRVLGRVARHGPDRRHAQPARSRAGRAVLHPVPGIPVDLDAELAAVFRAAVRRLHRLLAERIGRRVATADRAVPAQGGRGGRDGGALDRAGRAAARVPEACPACRRRGAGGARPREVVRRHQGGDRCVARRSRSFAARADRTQWRRQDDGLQPHHRHVRARSRFGRPRGPFDRGTAAVPDCRGGTGPFVPDHQPVSARVDRREPAPRGAGARCVAFRRLGRCAAQRARDRAHRGADPLSRAVRASNTPRRDRCRTVASGCSTWAWHSPARRACCCSTSRSPASPRRSASVSAA